MNFRTSYLVGLSALFLAVSSQFYVSPAQSEVLKVTGPNGESRQQVRQYGPTTVNDTFWSIAQRVRPDETVSIYQVMAAIFEANPQAFTSNNYNSLERGMILLIPSKEVMAAIPRNLARDRAEQDDKSWNRADAQVTQPAKPKLTPPPSEQPNVTPSKTSSAVDDGANKKIASLEAQNEQLKSQLAEMKNQLTESEAQRQALQAQNRSLDERLSQLENELAATKLQFARLKEELTAQASAASQATTESAASEPTTESVTPPEPAAAEPVASGPKKEAPAVVEQKKPAVEMPDDTWRQLMDNPLLLAAVTGGPAVILLLLLWLLLRRRKPATTDAAQNDTLATGAAADDMDAHDELAAMGDAEDTHDESHESLDDLFDVDNIELHPEQEIDAGDDQMAMAQEMFVDTGDDDAVQLDSDEEGQSLDDLWAEAIGEQADDETTKPADDDFDSLLDGLEDDEASLKDSLPDDVAAALEQDFGGDEDFIQLDDDEATTEDDNVGETADEFLAELDAELTETSQSTQTEDDLSDEIAAELDDGTESGAEEFDADALLAELEAEVPEQKTDLSDEIAAELDSDIDAAEEEFDPDKLLAELEAEAPADDVDLSAEIAEELSEDADDTAEEIEEFDADKLLAELEAESTPEDLTDEIAAELALPEDEAIDNSDLDADELLAELEAPIEPEDFTDDIAAELDDVDDESAEELDADALLAELEVNDDELAVDTESTDELDADALLAELEQAAPKAEDKISEDDDSSDFDFSLEDELAHPAEDENLDSLLAELSEEETRKSAKSKDSGFFNDLKASPKNGDANTDALLEELGGSDDLSLSDDELLKQFSTEEPAVEDDEFELSLVEDDDDTDAPRITVDEALAALDSEELAKRPVTPVSDSELASFQKENGFIDIDRLLNDADESEVEAEPYKSREVDMGDIDSLMNDTDMVDVDDEENSVNAKLDLARAYIEIDDSDSAKALLQEVQADGNTRQKEEAANLLKDID